MISHGKIKPREKDRIEGRKIVNVSSFNCHKPQKMVDLKVIENIPREHTFETDSIKQLLTKRNRKPINKENNNSINKHNLKKNNFLENQNSSQNKSSRQMGKKIMASHSAKFLEKKSVSLVKLFRKNDTDNLMSKREGRNSYSPHRSKSKSKNYQSNRNLDKKNFLTNYNSKQPTQKLLTKEKINEKKLKQEKFINKPSKIHKNPSKSYINSLSKVIHLDSKTQSLVKEFDNMIKQKSKQKKKKDKKQKTKTKKVLISGNNHKINLKLEKLQQYNDTFHQLENDVLKRKYHKEKKQKKGRFSFNNTKIKPQKTIKTECLSPELDIGKLRLQQSQQYNTQRKIKLVIKIQKVFRGYLTRKYLQQYKKIILSVLKIQKCWRSYRDRKKVQTMKYLQKIPRLSIDKNLEEKSQDVFSHRVRQKSPQKVHQLIKQSLSKGGNQQIQKWTQLLEEILYEEDAGQKIRGKILEFIQKTQKKSAEKNTMAHRKQQQQISSQKRFIDKRKKINLQISPKIESPKLDDSIKDPGYFIDNLIALRKVHKQNIITNAQLKKQDLNNLLILKSLSPKTHQIKKKEIDEKLNQQIKRFETGIDQVIKSCQNTPFPILKTPQSGKINKKQMNEFQSSQKLKQLQLQIHNGAKFAQSQQLSVVLSSHFCEASPRIVSYQPFDSSFTFIQDYLLNLIQYLSQYGNEFKDKFLSKIKQKKNLDLDMILKNLPLVTEESQEDITFKLPLYKYLQNEEIQYVNKQIVQQFNSSYKKLQRHHFNTQNNLQQIFIKMIIDCLHQALNIQRPISYIFTSTRNLSTNLPKLSEFKFEKNEVSLKQQQFSYYFANAMNSIYKWSTTFCGSTSVSMTKMGILNNQMKQQQWLNIINQTRLRELLNIEANTNWVDFDQLIQIIVEVSQCVFQQIILQEGAFLYYKRSFQL